MAVPARLEALFSALPLKPLRRLVPRSLVSVQYHMVSDEKLPWVEHLYSSKTPEQFERDLVYFKENWNPVSHDDIVAHVDDERPLPPNAVSLTMDDGFYECFSVVRPLLLKHGIPCTFFVISGVLDRESMMFRNKTSLCFSKLAEISEPGQRTLEAFNDGFGLGAGSLDDIRIWLDGLQFEDEKRIDSACDMLGVDLEGIIEKKRLYMNSDEIRMLHEDGFSIGAHSVHHPRLWLLPSFEQVEREIVESVESLRSITGVERTPIAFPFNSGDLSRDGLERLRRDHPQVDLMYDTNNLMRDRDFIVNRIPADEPSPAAHRGPDVAWTIKRAHALEPLRFLQRRFLRRGRRGASPHRAEAKTKPKGRAAGRAPGGASEVVET